MIIYWIIYSLIICGLILTRLLSIKIEKFLKNSYKINFTYEDIIYEIDKIITNNGKGNNIRIIKGNYYRFDRKKNEIVIKELETYSILDLFICFHEIGHFIESKKIVILSLYKIIEVITIINIFFIYPIVIVNLFMLIVSSKAVSSVLFLFLSISIILFIIKIISIPFIEIRASLIAKKYFKKLVINKITKYYLNKIKISYALAIIDQILLQLIFMCPIVLIFYVVKLFL